MFRLRRALEFAFNIKFNGHVLFSYRHPQAKPHSRSSYAHSAELIGTLQRGDLASKNGRKFWSFNNPLFHGKATERAECCCNSPYARAWITCLPPILSSLCARCALVYLWNCVILGDIARNNFIISLNSKMSCIQFFAKSQSPVLSNIV